MFVRFPGNKEFIFIKQAYVQIYESLCAPKNHQHTINIDV